MGHYKSNLRDIEFNLFEVFGRRRRARHRARSPSSTPTPPARSCARSRGLAEHELAAVLRSTPTATRRSTTRPTHTVTLPESLQEVLRGLHGRRVVAPRPARASSAAPVAPPSLRWADRRADPRRQPGRPHVLVRLRPSPASLYDLGTDGAEAAGRSSWSTSSGAPRWCSPSRTPAPTSAPAAPRPSSSADGTWHIEGVKRFITSGEHDMTENIVHLVLARPRGRGGPGTKGLSLFVVPEVPLRPRDRRARRAQRRLRHQRRAQDGPEGLHHLRADASARRRARRSAGWSATCTTASRRCSRSSSTPG